MHVAQSVSLTLLLRDNDGRVRGGVRAMAALCWLQIDHFGSTATFAGRDMAAASCGG